MVTPGTDREHIDQHEEENSNSQQIETPQNEEHDNNTVLTNAEKTNS